MLFSSSVPQQAAHRGWERWGIGLLLLIVIGFGVDVEIRSAFMKRRMTDLDVYLRAAWAVRTGGEVYQIEDDNHWHYNYPPLLAIALTPLADPPAGADRTGMVPFAVSVAVWYVFSLLCLIAAIHWLASTLEQTSSNAELRTQPAGSRRWWTLRLWPFLICMPAVASTLMRGQVNLLLLALLCGMAVAALRGRSGQAGLWLAGAICLKVIPAFLLIYPLWRRDVRWLVGCAVGLVIGLGVIPAAAFGPGRAVDHYRQYYHYVVQPGISEGGDKVSRAKELLEITSTGSQSLLATMHNSIYLDRTTRPANAAPELRRAHWAIGGVLTLLTLAAAGWRRRLGSSAEVVFLGALLVLMVVISPVCHLHYFTLALPLVMGLLARAWEPHQTRGALPPSGIGLLLLLGSNVIASTLPRVPGLEVLRDLGMAMYAALALWLVGCVVLRKRVPAPAPANLQRQAA